MNYISIKHSQKMSVCPQLSWDVESFQILVKGNGRGTGGHNVSGINFADQQADVIEMNVIYTMSACFSQRRESSED